MKPSSVNPPILDLPSHIFTVIISLLPLKSILFCKLVCKMWCSIISNPEFSLPSHRFALIVHRWGLNLSDRNLYVVEPEFDLVVSRLNGCGFDGVPVETLEFVNSCNGLFCLSSIGDDYSNMPLRCISMDNSSYKISGPFFVCNPVTSEYIVSKKPRDWFIDRYCLREYCGFGYSADSNKYKVLRFKKNGDRGKPLIAEIYTFGCDENWRRIESPPQIDDVHHGWQKARLFFEGSLHWIIWAGRKRLCTIVAFDFEKEKFSLFPPPNMPYTIFGMDLAILNQQLCFCAWSRQGKDNKDFCDIWVMDEYGVEESWRTLFVVPHPEDMDSDPDCVFLFPDLMPLKPLAYLKNGEVLMLTAGSNLVSYNVRSNKTTLIEIPGFSEPGVGLEVMLFNPSLAPIKNLVTPHQIDQF